MIRVLYDLDNRKHTCIMIHEFVTTYRGLVLHIECALCGHQEWWTYDTDDW